jgi:hypothetical protein
LDVGEGQTRGSKSFALALLAITTNEIENLEIHPNGLQKNPETPVFFAPLGDSRKAYPSLERKPSKKVRWNKSRYAGKEMSRSRLPLSAL